MLRIVLSLKVVLTGAPIWLLREPNVVVGRSSLLQVGGLGFRKVMCFHRWISQYD